MQLKSRNTGGDTQSAQASMLSHRACLCSDKRGSPDAEAGACQHIYFIFIYLYKYFTSYNLSTLRSLWVDVTILIVWSQRQLENSGESFVHFPCWSSSLLEQQKNRCILHQCTLTSSPCYQETIWETYWTQRTRRQQDKDQLHLILRRWELVL